MIGTAHCEAIDAHRRGDYDWVRVGRAQVEDRDLAALASRGENLRLTRIHADREHSVIVQEHVAQLTSLF